MFVRASFILRRITTMRSRSMAIKMVIGPSILFPKRGEEAYKAKNIPCRSSGLPLLSIGKLPDAVLRPVIDLRTKTITLALVGVTSGNGQAHVADAVVHVRALFFTHRASFHRHRQTSVWGGLSHRRGGGCNKNQQPGK